MKRFDFRLQRLLRLRQQLQKQAELRQGQVSMQLEAAKVKVSRIESELAQRSLAMAGYVGQSIDPAVWQNGFQNVLQMNDTLNAAIEEKDKVAEQLEVANKQRADATRDTEAIDFLRERKLKEHEYEVQREMQYFQDEIAMRLWRKPR